jgi:hypothetical protein
MKHIKTFEGYISNVNEATEWFPGENIDDRIEDGSPDWNKFLKGAKKGDTFYTLPDGVELYTCAKSDVNKPAIEPEYSVVGHNYQAKGDEPGAKATIIDRKKVNLIGTDYDEKEKIDTIFYTVDGDNSTVYLLPEM